MKEATRETEEILRILEGCSRKSGELMQATFEKILADICAELIAAEKKFPGWPDDVVHAAGIVTEESGELMQAALDYYYGREKSIDKMKKEATQTAAMGLRFLINIIRDGQ